MNNRFADQFMLVCFSIQKDSTLRKKDAVLGRFRLFQCLSWLVFMSKIGAGLVHLVHKPASNLPNPLSPGTSSVDGLHRGEEEDVADAGGVGQEHHQAIHAESEAAGGGQDGLVRPSVADFCCAARVFTFFRSCSRSAGRSLSGIPNASPEDEVHQTVMINRP